MERLGPGRIHLLLLFRTAWLLGPVHPHIIPTTGGFSLSSSENEPGSFPLISTPFLGVLWRQCLASCPTGRGLRSSCLSLPGCCSHRLPHCTWLMRLFKKSLLTPVLGIFSMFSFGSFIA